MNFTAGKLFPQFCQSASIDAFSRRHNLHTVEAMKLLLRHEIWPERFRRNNGPLTSSEQGRLLDLPIFIAGCGGLGGELAALLAHLGAGKLLLCDYDFYDESNLNRQRFCTVKNLGQPKAMVVAKALEEISPWASFKPVIMKLAMENLPELLEDSAMLVDCLDSVSAKKMLEDAAKKRGIAFLHGSVLEQEGFAFLEAPASGVLSRLYSSLFSETGAGATLAHVVAGTASLMAALFIRWLKRLPQTELLHADFSIPELENFQLP